MTSLEIGGTGLVIVVANVLLRSERAASAQNLSVAASNNRDQAPRSVCHFLFVCHMGVVLRAHSVRGEPRIQRNASGEVATVLRERGP